MRWSEGDYIRATGAAVWPAADAPWLHVLPLIVYALMLRRPSGA